MWGAIIGDLAGSIYEFDQIKKVTKLEPKELITDKSFFSDDTILTIALLDSILHDNNYEKYLKKYAKEYMDKVPKDMPYFQKMFSPSFEKYVYSDNQGTSLGNGCMMRISPIGFMFNTKEDVKKNAYLATIPSHNNPISIECATKVALIIYYARIGFSKDKIINELNINLKYKDFDSFNMTASDTIDNCLYALFTSNSYEDAVLKVISYGGDTDTNAAIVGAMAEALFGIDNNLILQAKEKLPDRFINILDKGYKKIKKL